MACVACSVLLAWLELTLYSQGEGMYPAPLLALTTTLGCLLAGRLQEQKRLTDTAAWTLGCVHGAKLVLFLVDGLFAYPVRTKALPLPCVSTRIMLSEAAPFLAVRLGTALCLVFPLELCCLRQRLSLPPVCLSLPAAGKAVTKAGKAATSVYDLPVMCLLRIAVGLWLCREAYPKAVEFYDYSHQLADGLSQPSIMFKARLQNG
eukprot:SAG22_NODE_4001_length_1429_cov_1.694737_1_plen_204_part_10